MYVSGTLKKKAIEFYKPSITNFSGQEFMTDKIIYSYDGELLVLPWNKSLEEKLAKRQETLILQEIEKSQFIATKKFGNIDFEIKQILKTLQETERKYSFALLECFYKLIMDAHSKEELTYQILNFKTFLNDIETKDYNQIDLDILISLFLKQKKYHTEALKKAKEQKFQIIEDEIPTDSLRDIITFGEFVSPNRVPKIATSLSFDIEYSNLVLPIYFAISNELEANQFLKLCRTPDLDSEKVKKNARLLRIPTNLQNLIR